MSWPLAATEFAFPNFSDEASHVFLNPRFSEVLRTELLATLAAQPYLPEHVVLTTSGTTGQPKLLALGKKAFRASAARVNAELAATMADRWHCPLPLFHVGGLSIGARAQALGQAAPCVLPFGEWSPARFEREVREHGCTLTAMVPTQLADLVAAGLRAPSPLRSVLIGGAALSPELFAGARALGWPLVPSYGLTESCAAVAFARTDPAPEAGVFIYEFLKSVVGRTEADGRLAVRCDSLATGYADAGEWRLPLTRDGYFLSSDLVEFCAGAGFLHRGRADELLKVRGEFVSPQKLAQEAAGEWGWPVDSLRFVVDGDQRLRLEVDRALVTEPVSVAAWMKTEREWLKRQGIRDVRWTEFSVSWKR